jgi:hypothetical protein
MTSALASASQHPSEITAVALNLASGHLQLEGRAECHRPLLVCCCKTDNTNSKTRGCISDTARELSVTERAVRMSGNCFAEDVILGQKSKFESRVSVDRRSVSLLTIWEPLGPEAWPELVA